MVFGLLFFKIVGEEVRFKTNFLGELLKPSK